MIRIASFNIKCASMCNYDVSMIAQDISDVGAQIAGIQEVDRNTERNGNADTAAQLASACALEHWTFAPAMDYKGGQYGIGILSAYQPDSVYMRVYGARLDGDEPRTFVSHKLKIDGKTLYFINTHLSYISSDIQKEQMQELGGYLRTLDAPFVLTGDFNTDDFTLFDSLGIDGITLVNGGEGRYYPTFYPDVTGIDNIVLSNGLSLHGSGMYSKRKSSDHYMLYADIDFE